MNDNQKAALVFSIGVGCGVLVWALSVPITGFEEPFDAPSLYYIASMFFAGVIATIPGPKYWWLAVIGIYLGERFYGLFFLPQGASYFLFAFVMNLIVPTWLPSTIGALITCYLGREGK